MDTINRDTPKGSVDQGEPLEASAAVRLHVRATRVTLDLAISADVLIPVALILAAMRLL